MINWSLLQTPNVAGMFQAGLDEGRQRRAAGETQSALAALARDPSNPEAMGVLSQYSPELAMRMQDRQRQTRQEDQRRDVMGRLFSPQEGGAGQGVLSQGVGEPRPSVGALQGYAPGAFQSPAQPPMATQGAGASAAAAGAPAQLVDPSALPPRTDGLRINHQALRELYALDPKTAFDIQSSVYKADAAALERTRETGVALAGAAFRLQQMTKPDGMADMEGRAAELRAMAPMLGQMGVPVESLQAVDLSDQGLQRYGALYRNLSDVIRDDRADRRLTADIADDAADNERADMDTRDRMADRAGRRALTARGQDMTDARGRYGIGVASADRQRGQNMSSDDRRRGQDLTATTARRGQDMTDKRVRETGGRRRSGSANIPTVSSVAEARKLPPGTVFRTPDGKMKVRP